MHDIGGRSGTWALPEKLEWFGDVGANPDHLKGTFARLSRLRADRKLNGSEAYLRNPSGGGSRCKRLARRV
jgi:hypothetical protein